MEKAVFGLLVVSLLSGCSSAPRQVNATVPLVPGTIKPVGQPVEQKYHEPLSDPLTTTLIHAEYSIQVGPYFLSSLGKECRSLDLRDNVGNKQLRVVCLEQVPDNASPSSWFLVPNIVQSTSSMEL
jgi:hypothetical protein|tara:strand:+ start:934 stop:1311 length:378 start_codon:yes stop_codon:yes gene_type:complete